jgi:hypothetical protein
MKSFFYIVAFFLGSPMLASPACAQEHPQEHPEEHGSHHSAPRANQGHIPAAPPKVQSQQFKREEEHGVNGSVDRTPHVNNDHWYGHDDPADKRYHQDRPFEHGHFIHVGPTYRYRILRIDRDQRQVWFPGSFYFEVASWDWPLCSDWCWDCGDDFVVYDDPDHIGWYLLYNIHTGVYVHILYMGT